jgi:superfamily II DNA or RNA helicase
MSKPDRREKKKKEREEKRRAFRQRKQRLIRREKVEEYGWLAEEAFAQKDHRGALDWALKGLAIDPIHRPLMNLALSCAQTLQDDPTLYGLLRQCWRGNILRGGPAHWVLGKLAFQQKDLELAGKVLQKLLEAPRTREWRLSRDQRKEAEEYFELCRNLELPLFPKPKSAPRSPSIPEREPLAPPGEKVQESAPNGLPSSPDQPVEEKPGREIEDSLELKVSFELNPAPLLETVKANRRDGPEALELALKAYKLSFQGSYDQLLCLSTLRNVESLWYQEETARKVMKTFRGRAILADEVGLGKTVEAGMILKEYLMRGLVRTALVLVPSSLVFQWQEELREKFDLPFVSSQDPLFREDPERFWAGPFLLVSLQTARTKRHLEAITSRSFDLVIVDEAHHLKNRATGNWKVVNALQKTFLLLLTATPVQNKLEELFNLVTLLKPGHLKTLKAFKEEFVTRGSPTDPRNREKLRHLLKEVMVRNTRSITRLRLPPRFAFTTRVTPAPQESLFYQKISDLVRSPAPNPENEFSRLGLRRLMEAAGSSHFAALRILERMAGQSADGDREKIKDILLSGADIRAGSKSRKVIELLQASPGQKIVFVNYRATLEHLQHLLGEEDISLAVLHGGLTAAQKQSALEAFQKGTPVLLSTPTGGEGYNLHFCHVMINYDLPWNPMQIEQRIGRLHRIGQEKEVQVYNFCAGGSLEDSILEILDRKINMFELVIGEIEMILGRVEDEQEFSDLVYEIWVKNPDESQRQKAFDLLGTRLQRARHAYEESKELDGKIFGEDFGL